MIPLLMSISSDVPKEFERLAKDLDNSDALMLDLGNRLAEELRDFYYARDAAGPRNQLGAPSSGFWANIGDSVGRAQISGNVGSVTIADPAITQKVFGGPIKADGGLLSIPARVEAYNKSPRLFANLKFVMFASGAMALVSKEGKLERGQKGIGRSAQFGLVYYWLVKETRPQAPDPNALPAQEKLEAALADTAQKHLNRILNN